MKILNINLPIFEQKNLEGTSTTNARVIATVNMCINACKKIIISCPRVILEKIA